MRRLLPAVLAALLITLTACDPKTGLTPDSITISVHGLPTDLKPTITITGPDGYEQQVTETTTLEELAPGTYTVTAAPVTPREVNRLDPMPATSTVTLEAGATKAVSIAYAPHRAFSRAATERLNEYRLASGLQPVEFQAERSLPNWLHARYLAENRETTHSQDPSLPWHTPAGHQAGLHSSLAFTGSSKFDDPEWAIDAFASAPFHFFHLLNPTATTVRIGTYFAPSECPDTYECEFAFDRQAVAVEMNTSYQWPAGKVVRFPADGFTVNTLRHIGEVPPPLSACPSYEEPAGMPIFVMHGPNKAPRVTSTSLTLNGEPVEHCTITASTYTNPDPGAQDQGRLSLTYHGGVIIVPRAVLQPSTTYEVTVEYESGSDQWQFHTASETRPLNLEGVSW